MSFKKFTPEEFEKYVESLNVKRNIKRVQLHHTWSPSYAQFKGNNHITLQNNMRNYHVNSNGWADIGQHFTIFPDGAVVTGRNMESAPAGIYGANTGSICIECVGNFDKGGDDMTDAQKNGIVRAVKVLLEKFNLTPENGVVYHAWYGSGGKEIGDYVKGQSQKTCPGTNFFGGNTLTAYTKNLLPLLKGKEEKQMLETGNDIVWELVNGKHKIEITEQKRAIEALDKAKNDPEFMSLYWIIYKIVNG